MTDDRSERGPQDALRVSVNEPWEVRYWCEELGVTPEQLKQAVRRVGPMVEDVRLELGK